MSPCLVRFLSRLQMSLHISLHLIFCISHSHVFTRQKNLLHINPYSLKLSVLCREFCPYITALRIFRRLFMFTFRTRVFVRLCFIVRCKLLRSHRLKLHFLFLNFHLLFVRLNLISIFRDFFRVLKASNLNNLGLLIDFLFLCETNMFFSHVVSVEFTLIFSERVSFYRNFINDNILKQYL